MRQPSVLIQFLVSIPIAGLCLGGAIAQAVADEATAPETAAPALKPPVPKTAETVSNPSVRLAIPENHATDMPTLAPRRASGKNTFIDTRNYAPPSEVVVTERRGNGCQTIARGGQLVGGRCAATALAPRPRATERIAKPLPPIRLTASRRPAIRQPETVAIQPRRQRVFVNNPVRQYAPALVASAAPVRLAPPRVIPSEVGTVVALNPPEWNGVRLALAPVTRSVETYPTVESATLERSTRLSPTVPIETRRTDLLFPLAIPAPITSVFGWRNHPVTGRRAMHAGTDLGAPMGTPVLAAYPGVVETADWVGGYGLMVILRHLDGTQESRYAHLSEINVTPGESVQQGQVIGRVGSTGMSTGPHLHFEWRHLTEEGWTAVDAGLHLEFALENLMERMQTATTTEAPETPNPNQG